MINARGSRLRPTAAPPERVPALWLHAYSDRPGWRRACARFVVSLLDDRWPTVPPLF